MKRGLWTLLWTGSSLRKFSKHGLCFMEREKQFKSPNQGTDNIYLAGFQNCYDPVAALCL